MQKPLALRARTLNPPGQALPFDQLTPYEPVSTQFTPWGIEFAAAIALYPSNPSFLSAVSDMVVMPTASTIEINLLKPLRHAGLRLRGHHDIRLKALSAKGEMIACKKIFCHRYSEATKAPLEILTLDLRRVRTLLLSSSVPFVLESFSL